MSSIEAACGCDAGCVRANNEDNFLFHGSCFDQAMVSLPRVLYFQESLGSDTCLAVFDGMGGGDYGEEASLAAAERLKVLTGWAEKAEPLEFLGNAALEANLAVCAKQRELGSRRMGSTMAALYFSGNAVYACNVGDSRIFGLRGDTLLQISQDHTDETFMKERGVTGRKPRLTQYLGMDPQQVQIDPHIVKGSLEDGDLYLICSDGLTDMLTQQQIRDALQAGGNLRQTVHALVRSAKEQGGLDNITVILCRIHLETKSTEEIYERYTNEHPMAWLGDRAQTWGRQLRCGLRDAARRLRNR